MSALSLATLNLAEASTLINSFSTSINPYTFIEQAILEGEGLLFNKLDTFSSVLVAFMILYFVLWFTALVSLCVKGFKTKDGELRKISLWKKVDPCSASHRYPYYVPDGYVMVELLQIVGCMIFSGFFYGAYHLIRNPETKFDLLHSIILPCFAVSFAPGFLGFWWNSWSSFYVILLSPATQHAQLLGGRNSILRHPLLMNTTCICASELDGINRA